MISRLKQAHTPPAFSVMDLFGKITEEEAAEKTADYFTRISDGFEPISHRDVPPSEKRKDVIKLLQGQVRDRIVQCKKPKGLLAGDIFPQLLSDHAMTIAEPLTDVLNTAF